MKRNDLTENIEHATEARPFSIHDTQVDAASENALYLHCHPEAEFFYLETGEITFWVEDRSFPMKAGDGMFLPPNLVHHATKASGVPCSYSAMVFSVNWLTGYLSGEDSLYTRELWEQREECICHLRKEMPENAKILEILAGFLSYRKQPIYRYEMKLFGELLICFQELYNRVFSRVECRKQENVGRPGIQKSLDYIKEHYDRELTLAELAKCSGYSESHFCRSMKETTGYSPFEYLNRIRVIKASEALFLTEDKITEIASRCGYDNISYFNRVFRKQMGMSPGQYRRDVRSGIQ